MSSSLSTPISLSTPNYKQNDLQHLPVQEPGKEKENLQLNNKIAGKGLTWTLDPIRIIEGYWLDLEQEYVCLEGVKKKAIMSKKKDVAGPWVAHKEEPSIDALFLKVQPIRQYFGFPQTKPDRNFQATWELQIESLETKKYISSQCLCSANCVERSQLIEQIVTRKWGASILLNLEVGRYKQLVTAWGVRQEDLDPIDLMGQHTFSPWIPLTLIQINPTCLDRTKAVSLRVWMMIEDLEILKQRIEKTKAGIMNGRNAEIKKMLLEKFQKLIEREYRIQYHKDGRYFTLNLRNTLRSQKNMALSSKFSALVEGLPMWNESISKPYMNVPVYKIKTLVPLSIR